MLGKVVVEEGWRGPKWHLSGGGTLSVIFDKEGGRKALRQYDFSPGKVSMHTCAEVAYIESIGFFGGGDKPQTFPKFASSAVKQSLKTELQHLKVLDFRYQSIFSGCFFLFAVRRLHHRTVPRRNLVRL